MTQQESVRTSFWLLIVTVMIVASNLRTTVQGVGSLIDQIGGDTGLTPTALGLLGALPLLMYALVSPIAHSISHRFGMNRTVFVSLLVLLAATIVRSIDAGLAPLWIGTILTGAAIAVANVLMPAVIKHWFPDRLHAVMPVYTAVLAGTGALASGLVVPISHITWGDAQAGWRFALLTTGILIVPGLIMWLIAVRRAGSERIAGEVPEPRRKGIWGDPVAWLVALYMGFQGAAFYMLVTWLSPLSISYGTSEVQAGIEVMVMQLFSLGGSLSVPFLLRGWGRRWLPALIPIPGLLGLVGLMIWPQSAWVWGPIFGYASGAMFAISMWLMADRARNRSDATSLSGMAQSAGYLICGLGPIAFAALHTLTEGWVLSLCLAAVCMIGLLVVGFLLRDHRYAFDRRAERERAGS
ncbi:MAG TPA: MFS transporter [Microbacteriaceae bacterium]|nr:MFS transporter [Microbacteriaceae bacterium]